MASFAFIISLVREVIKDMEDMEGDARYGCRTMPLVWGLNASKFFCVCWLTILVAALIFIQFYVLAIQMVVNDCLYLFRCDLSHPPGVKKIIPGNRTCSISPTQPADQIHYDDGNSFHDFFKILYFMDRIILASASPRRKQLLEWAEIPFDILPSDADELDSGRTCPISEIPVFLASQKAAIVRRRVADRENHSGSRYDRRTGSADAR